MTSRTNFKAQRRRRPRRALPTCTFATLLLLNSLSVASSFAPTQISHGILNAAHNAPTTGAGSGTSSTTVLHVQPITTDPSPNRYEELAVGSPVVGSIGNGSAAGNLASSNGAAPATLQADANGNVPNAPSVGGSSGRVTLTRFLQDMVQERPELRGMDLPLLSVQMACKTISNLVNRAGINQLTPPPGSSSSGSEQADLRLNSMKRLDQLSANVLRNALRFTGKLKLVAPKETEADREAEALGQHQPGVLLASAIEGKYVGIFDPLDGSGNADAAICTGTVFGLFENLERKKEIKEQIKNGNKDAVEERFTLKKYKDPDALARSVLQPGKNLVGAGYCLYSSATILVFTLAGGSVNGFTLDPQSNEFILTHPNIRIPPRGNVYSCNEANSEGWDDDLRQYIKALKTGDNETGKPNALRYVGSKVGDIHRTLMYGGLFMYPGDSGTHPHGNLQLLYKSGPMAHLICAAGGMATDGKQNLLDLEPKRVHERRPCFIGSPEDIKEMKKYIKHNEE